MNPEKNSNSPETIEARNHRIRNELENGMLPVLPFEKAIIEQQLNEVIAAQDKIGKELSVVNHQGSENYHDNFAANQAEYDSMVLKKRGSLAVATFERAVDVGYPGEGDEITLGSLLELNISDSAKNMAAVLTGKIRELGETQEVDLPDNLTVATLESPLGMALLGAKAGETIAYQAGGREREVLVVSVRQMQPDAQY